MRAAAALLALALLAGIVLGGRAVWQKWSARPQSASSVQDSVRAYLKKHASPKDFNSDYDFTLKATVGAMQTNATKLREEVLTLRTNLAIAQKDLAILRAGTRTKQTSITNAESVTNLQETLAAKQAEVKTLREKLNEQENTTSEARRDLAKKEQLLANQHAMFAREIRTNITAAPSYESIYTWIGRALATADRLLASSEFADQRSGAMLAEDAANYAIHNAENSWLAARICEGWVWPSAEKYDAPGKAKVSLNQVLQTCADAFNRAGETNNLLRNYELRLKYAPTARAADGVRYYLANTLEQAGRAKEALETYRAIQDTNYLGYAQRRIAAIEKRTATN